MQFWQNFGVAAIRLIVFGITDGAWTLYYAAGKEHGPKDLYYQLPISQGRVVPAEITQ
jgi:hypothetical protein